MLPILSTTQLSKEFKVPTRQAGLKASFGALFHRTYNNVKAVEQVSFQIEPGEVVGFLGLNGTGKTSRCSAVSARSVKFPMQIFLYYPLFRENL